MTERPTFISEQTRKLSRIFRQMERMGKDSSGGVTILAYKEPLAPEIVYVDAVFIRGMERVLSGIKKDLAAEGVGELFYKTYINEKRKGYEKNQ